MKTGKANWVLLPIVIIIWFTLGIQFFTTTKHVSVDLQHSSSQLLAIPFSGYQPPALELSFNDPFLKEAGKSLSPTTKGQSDSQLQLEATPLPFTIPALQYLGFIYRIQETHPSAIIRWKEKTLSLRVNDSIAGGILRLVSKDSIKVDFGDRTLSFYRQSR